MSRERLDATVGMLDRRPAATSCSSPEPGGAGSRRCSAYRVPSGRSQASATRHEDRTCSRADRRGSTSVERRADVVAHAPRVVAGRDPGPASISWRSPSTSTQPGAASDLVVAHDVGVEAPGSGCGCCACGPRARAERRLEASTRTMIGTTSFGSRPKRTRLQRLDDLVADRTDLGALGRRRQLAARAHGPLLDAARHAGVRVDHVAVGVLAEAEAELEAAVARRGHRADLLGPRPVARSRPLAKVSMI